MWYNIPYMPDVKHFGYKHWTLEDPPRCFNVGKGLKGRAQSRRNRNHKWHAISKRYGLLVEVCVEFSTNKEACAWEIDTIANDDLYTTNHSHDDHDDIRCNFTRGGEGITGWKHRDASRQQMSIKRRGISLGPMSEAHKHALSEARIGTHDTDEVRQHKSEAHKRPEVRARRSLIKSRPVVQCNDAGEVLSIFPSVNAAALESGGDKGCIAACARGSRNPRHAGFMWRYVDLMTKDTQ